MLHASHSADGFKRNYCVSNTFSCSWSSAVWQRATALQIVRSLVLEPQGLYTLFVTFDASIEHDLNAVEKIVRVCGEVMKAFVKLAADNPEVG